MRQSELWEAAQIKHSSHGKEVEPRELGWAHDDGTLHTAHLPAATNAVSAVPLRWPACDVNTAGASLRDRSLGESASLQHICQAWLPSYPDAAVLWEAWRDQV